MLSAVRIGVIVHERRMQTHATGPCRSACAYVWIAGMHMLADEGVEISNHPPVPLLAEHTDQRGIAMFGWNLGKLDISVAMMTPFWTRRPTAEPFPTNTSTCLGSPNTGTRRWRSSLRPLLRSRGLRTSIAS